MYQVKMRLKYVKNLQRAYDGKKFPFQIQENFPTLACEESAYFFGIERLVSTNCIKFDLDKKKHTPKAYQADSKTALDRLFCNQSASNSRNSR